MITRQQQPSKNSCGQTCIAMLLGIPAVDVIAEISDARGTIARQLADYLNARGYRVTSRCMRYVSQGSLGETALCRVRWGDDPKNRRAHWVLWADGKFWDPLADKPIFLRKNGRVLSFLGVFQ